jgi:hypothetical protein
VSRCASSKSVCSAPAPMEPMTFGRPGATSSI